MKKKGILIGILALIIIIFLGILYFNDDTRIYKETVNATYEVLDNTLDKYQNIIGFLNEDKKMSLELNDSKEKFNLDLLLSSRNENIYANLKYHNQDWAYLYTNNTSYLKKNNIYQAFDYEVKECEECSPTSLNTILSNTFSPSNVTSKDLKVILKDLKTTVNKSWHQNYITKRKIKDFKDTPLIIHQRYLPLINDYCLNKLIQIQLKVTCDDSRTSLIWAISGIGVAICPMSSLALPYDHSLVYTILEDKNLYTGIAFITRKNEEISALLNEFIERFK